jgi:riboflavin synthase
MFTGIIKELGTIDGLQRVGAGLHLTIAAPQSSAQLAVNDSVSINGVCLTVIGKDNQRFTVEAVEETLKKTTIGELRLRDKVNLELALTLNERLGGHLVLGHVDGVGVVAAIEQRERSWLFDIEIPVQYRRYVIPVGSIAIDGVSLTVAETRENIVRVSIIPHTFFNTTFQFMKAGRRVNIEFDVIGKYIERLLTEGRRPDEITPDEITVEKMRSWGYKA